MQIAAEKFSGMPDPVALLRAYKPEGKPLTLAATPKSEVPVAVGFGIGSPEHAATVSLAADGVIIGSKLVRIAAEAAPETVLSNGRLDLGHLDEVIEVIRETFAAKPAVIDVNIEALRKGYELGAAAKQPEQVEA